jgi:anti-sigma factor RsiW
MNPCDQWREALADCALGAPPSAALSKHLQDCPSCSNALHDSQARLHKIDESIRQLVGSEPSAHAVNEILARVASRSRPQRWFSRRMAQAAALAALILLAVSAIVVWRQREKRKDLDETLSAAASISNWRSPTEDLLHSPYDSLHQAPPRLGEYFYPVKMDASSTNHQAPPEKEKQNP